MERASRNSHREALFSCAIVKSEPGVQNTLPSPQQLVFHVQTPLQRLLDYDDDADFYDGVPLLLLFLQPNFHFHIYCSWSHHRQQATGVSWFNAEIRFHTLGFGMYPSPV